MTKEDLIDLIVEDSREWQRVKELYDAVQRVGGRVTNLDDEEYDWDEAESAVLTMRVLMDSLDAIVDKIESEAGHALRVYWEY